MIGWWMLSFASSVRSVRVVLLWAVNVSCVGLVVWIEIVFDWDWDWPGEVSWVVEGVMIDGRSFMILEPLLSTVLKTVESIFNGPACFPTHPLNIPGDLGLFNSH